MLVGTRRERKREAREEVLHIVSVAKILKEDPVTNLTDRFRALGFTGDHVDLSRALRKLHSEGKIICAHFTKITETGKRMRMTSVVYIGRSDITADATA